MTYKKAINNIDSQKQEIMKQVEEQLNNIQIELDQPIEQNTYLSAHPLSDEDINKLVVVMNHDEKICEINTHDSNLIIGSIESFVDQEFVLNKQTYCLDNDLLIEGSLIVTDGHMKCYAKVQNDDIYRSNTIGKIIQTYDKYVYFTPLCEKKSQGEYELSKTKKLSLNTDPTLVRKRSATSMISKVTKPTTLTRRPSVGSILSPRTINKYRLIKFV